MDGGEDGGDGGGDGGGEDGSEDGNPYQPILAHTMWWGGVFCVILVSTLGPVLTRKGDKSW